MLNSGDNEFIYRNCKQGIKTGVFKYRIKELQKCFSEEEIDKWETT